MIDAPLANVLARPLGPEVVEEASIYLIVGGLVMLGFVVVLVLLRSIFPATKSSAPDHGRNGDSKSIRSAPTLANAGNGTGAPPPDSSAVDAGRSAARQVDGRDVDDFLDMMVDEDWGQPRILRTTDEGLVVRVYDCAECAGGEGVGCGRHVGFFAQAFTNLRGQNATVTELSCRRSGAPACDFEVDF